jgi:protein ImuB
LAEVAREFSPRIEVCSPTEIVLDLNGLTRLFGEARTIAEELRRTAADRGLRVRVAIAGTRTAARLLVRYRAGLTIIEPGNEAAAVAPLPIGLLGEVANAQSPEPKAQSLEVLTTFRRWGLRTLGDLAALPSDDLAARLGRQDLDWQRLARGEDARPLVPAVPEERFEQTLELEWPIEELEPLSFVLGRLMEALEAHLAQHDRGAAVLHVRLQLIKTDGTAAREVHERSLQLPVAIRDARTLRTLALLDLESNPPAAAIDRVTVAVDPTPARIVQYSLITRPLPTPEQISTLMARLHALMGEERCGSPVMVDSWEPGAFAMKAFMPPDATALHSRDDTQRHRGTEERLCPGEAAPIAAIRRFRHPMPVRVHVKQGRPASVSIMRRGLSGGAVDSCAGPWRTSGGWWQSNWDRDEWDVALADGPTYRLFRERHSDKWFLEGVVD